jgi:hypothetical protein
MRNFSAQDPVLGPVTYDAAITGFFTPTNEDPGQGRQEEGLDHQGMQPRGTGGN